MKSSKIIINIEIYVKAMRIADQQYNKMEFSKHNNNSKSSGAYYKNDAKTDKKII